MIGHAKQYIVVIRDDADSLAREVTRRMQLGWSLWGPPLSLPPVTGVGGHYPFAQAMVLLDSED